MTFVNQNTEPYEKDTSGENDYVLGSAMHSRQLTKAVDFFEEFDLSYFTYFTSVNPRFHVVAYEGENSHTDNHAKVLNSEEFSKALESGAALSISIECIVEIIDHMAFDDADETEIRSSYEIVRSNEKYDTIELAEQGAKKLCAEMDIEEFFGKFQN